MQKQKCAAIIIKIGNYVSKDEKSARTLSDKTGIDIGIINSIVSGKRKKYRSTTLDILYEFFWLEKDDFYKENMKRRLQPSESILGTILRDRRVQMWYSLEDVSALLKWDARSLARIESWDTLPAYHSYYITRLLQLYKFTKEESETLKRFICILRDLVKIAGRYQNDIDKTE